MKRIYGIALVATLLFTHLRAQGINQKDYEKVVDYFACECVKIAEGEKARDLNCDIDFIDNAELNRIAQAKTKELIHEIGTLKGRGTVSQDKQGLNSFFLEEVFNSIELPKIREFASNTKAGRMEEIARLKDLMSNYINNYNQRQTIEASPEVIDARVGSAQDNNVIYQREDSEPIGQERAKSSFWSFDLNIAQVLLVVLTILLNLFLFFDVKGKLRDRNSELRKLKDKISIFGEAKWESTKTKFSSADFDVDFKRIWAAIGQMEEKLTNMANNRQHKNEEKGDAIAPIVEEKVAVNLQEPQLEPPSPEDVFYMPTPNDDGSFETSSLTAFFSPTVSLFRFTVKKASPFLAEFEFYSDEFGLKDAVNYPQTYLDPVCESINMPIQHAKRIVTLKKGIAQKESDKWIVMPENKARIKYE